MSNVIDLHREISIAFLKSSSGYAVRTPRGQKEPGHFRWDPKNNNTEESSKTIHQLERSDDNVGIHLFGKVVDVDVDTDNPFLAAALDHFLPHTSHIWGRKSRPRTHRLYELAGSLSNPDAIYSPTDFPFLRALAAHADIKMEVRGGELKNGQYSLLPGSLHPSGEAYEWEDIKAARSSPATVDVYRLINGVRFACVAALIAPYWTEGSRNQLCMALSGFLHRAAAHAYDMGAAIQLSLDKNDAKSIIEGVMEIAGDDSEDYRMRMKTFEDTWQKADDGSPVTGASTLVKISGREDLLSILYTLLVDSPDLRDLDEFLERYAVRLNTSNVIDLTLIGVQNCASIMTVADFRNSYMHKNITIGTGEKRKMVDILLNSSRAIRVNGLCFAPEEGPLVDRELGKYVNSWRGFEIEPAPSATAEEVEPFLSYLKNIVCNHDHKSYAWVLAWIADIFKFPGQKPGTALVLVGKPGSGKSFLGANFIRAIIGRNHSTQTNTMDSILGTFNSDSANMMLIQCDEAINSKRRGDSLKLKSLITDEMRRIEPKHVVAYTVEDYARYLFTSNEETDAVAILDGEYDRRFTVLHTSEEYATNSPLPYPVKAKYWTELKKWAGDRENLAKLHRYFLDHTYPREAIKRPLDTEARRIMQQHSTRGFDHWLMSLVGYEHPFENLRQAGYRVPEAYNLRNKTEYVHVTDRWPQFVSYTRLEDSYHHYIRTEGNAGTTRYNAQQIKAEFIKRGLLDKSVQSVRIRQEYSEWTGGYEQKSERQIRVSKMPTKKDIEAFLLKKLGFQKVREEESEGIHVEQTTVSTEGPDY